MHATVLRCQRTSTLTIQPEPLSRDVPCAQCGVHVKVAPQSLKYGNGLTPICEVCLPAEPVGPLGLDHL